MKFSLTTAPLLGISTFACASVYNDFPPDETSLGLGGSLSAPATTGGGPATGGGASTGGALPTGGNESTGGTVSTGGAETGGSVATGGAGSGGASAGGSVSTGGASTGGTVAAGGTSSGGASTGGVGTGGTVSGQCASATLSNKSSAKCDDTFVFSGALYKCVAQTKSVNGEPNGCGPSGVYCSNIDPNNGAWGSTAWEKLGECE